jgi:hypothetical protein
MMAPTLEARVGSSAATANLRVDVLLRDGCEPFRGIAVDVSLVWPLQRAFVAAAASSPGGAATAAEAAKRLKYGPACEAAGLKLVPLVADMFGAWGASALPWRCRGG